MINSTEYLKSVHSLIKIFYHHFRLYIWFLVVYQLSCWLYLSYWFLLRIINKIYDFRLVLFWKEFSYQIFILFYFNYFFILWSNIILLDSCLFNFIKIWSLFILLRFLTKRIFWFYSNWVYQDSWFSQLFLIVSDFRLFQILNFFLVWNIYLFKLVLDKSQFRIWHFFILNILVILWTFWRCTSMRKITFHLFRWYFLRWFVSNFNFLDEFSSFHVFLKRQYFFAKRLGQSSFDYYKITHLSS